MVSEIISKFVSSNPTRRFLSYREIFNDVYCKNKSYSLRNGLCWEHEDLIAITQSYCNKNACRLIAEGEKYAEKIVIAYGAQTILLKSISALVRTGSFFEIDFCVAKKESKEITGKVSLKKHIVYADANEGLGTLCFLNDVSEIISYIKLGKAESLVLLLSGSIMVTSSIDIVLDR